jgi:hypothetical protein
LDRIHELIFRNGLRVVKHAREPITEGNRCHPDAGLLFDDAPNSVRTGVAAHAFDFEYGRFHQLSICVAEIKPHRGLRLGGTSKVKLRYGVMVIFDRFSRFCLPVDVRLAPKATFAGDGDKRKAR